MAEKYDSEHSSQQQPPRPRGNGNLPFTGMLYLAASSLGIIYGDIGTSPLYVFNAIFPSAGPAPSPEDTIGALSA